MPKQTIEQQVRERVLVAIEEIKDRNPTLHYKDIMQTLGEFQSVHAQLKTGTRYPTISMIYQLHDVYNYRFEWLFMGIGTKRAIAKNTPLTGLELIREGLSLLEANAPKRQQKALPKK